jgi:small subunit ribosomal protein S11
METDKNINKDIDKIAEQPDDVAIAKNRKSRKKRQVRRGNVYISSSYNNTIVTLSDMNGNVLITVSAGQCGFKGPKKATPYAAGVIVRTAAEKVKDYGLKEVAVMVKGIGGGREGAIRALQANNIEVISIRDVTPLPHNGCRKKKRRRV